MHINNLCMKVLKYILLRNTFLQSHKLLFFWKLYIKETVQIGYVVMLICLLWRVMVLALLLLSCLELHFTVASH